MTEAGLSHTPAAGAPVQPVRAGERLVTLDFIRGVAVLGILFANITAFGQPYMAYFWPPALVEPATGGDKLVWLFQAIFVDNKFRGLFSLLFGAGIYLFLQRASERGLGHSLQFRRLVVLLAFGLLHYFLIWRGDILTVYAVAGMFALPMLDWTARKQLYVGVASYVSGLVVMIALLGAAGGAELGSPKAAQDALDQARAESLLYREGSYAEIVQAAVSEHSGQLPQEVVLVVSTETLPLMLIGAALFRMGLFSGGMDPARLRRWGWIGVTVGALATVPIALWPYRADFPFGLTLFVFNGLARVGQLPMVLGLAALLSLWAPNAVRGWLGSCFAAAGRMAFSNYLGTSVLMMFVFHGWALGLFGQLGRVELLGVVLAAWALMLAWSPAWLVRFRYGPLEWLWRCLTYGRVFALLR
ncbi:DUF418 domain-containing protein [Altererythrobacter soli]|uniref:DUF418 domain-containing protein n=1 Tax=Croceibacterium soli TaxID=1739690 RepID=A0A6I4UWJ3_9SPHN|nr:DUF418 domain-containing protein [Croceibacterium soli]MXP41787.1 DUF418 domain-containing protein [Croceibacterium soli]